MQAAGGLQIHGAAGRKELLWCWGSVSEGAAADITAPGRSEASHTYGRTLLKTVLSVLDLEQQYFSLIQYL